MAKSRNTMEKQTKLKTLKSGDMVKIVSEVNMGYFAIILKDKDKIPDLEKIYILNTLEYTWYYRSSLMKVE